MNYSTTLYIGLDIHKDSFAIADTTAARSPSAIRNENTCRRNPDTELDSRYSLPRLYYQNKLIDLRTYSLSWASHSVSPRPLT
jgi:hypothetical protein